MIFFWLSPIYVGINAYFIYEISKWLTSVEKLLSSKTKYAHVTIVAIKIIYGILWILATFSTYTAFLIPSDTESLVLLRRILKLIGNYHLGLTIYMSMALAVILLSRLCEYIFYARRGAKISVIKERFFTVRRSILGLIYVLFIILITIYGAHHAGDIQVNPYEVVIDKEVPGTDELKIVLVADLHLGYNIGCEQMKKMVTLINEQDADLVIVAGDIFDNEYDALDNPEKLAEILSSIESKYGTYAAYGNHDVSEKIIGGFTFDWNAPKESSHEMDAFVEACGFTLLREEYVLINDNIYIYGRPDYERPGRGITSRLSPSELVSGLDDSKPIIVIDHEPRELQALADAGVDLDLCGHTHDGQFFPMNITCRYFTWENSAGLLKKDRMSNIVTSGVGLFGPNIRIGTQAEICPITIHFSKEK